MAGEQSNPQADYDNISSTKLMNKAGILELSTKIKAYVDANSSSGGTTYTAGNNVSIDNDTINVRIVPKVISINQNTTAANINADNKAYLNNTFVNGYVDYPCIIKAGTSYGQKGYYYYYMTDTDSDMLVFVGMSFNPSDTSYGGFQYLLLKFTNNVLSQITWNPYGTATSRLPAEGIRLPSGQSPTGSNTNVGAAMEYIKNNYAKKAELPAAYTLPEASTSTLGGVKVDGTTITIDANGVISSSGGGGGTTYTAGTGIDITNGVISVSLNRAEGGSY